MISLVGLHLNDANVTQDRYSRIVLGSLSRCRYVDLKPVQKQNRIFDLTHVASHFDTISHRALVLKVPCFDVQAYVHGVKVGRTPLNLQKCVRH
jgi:hypothetical protein